ncbi:MAG: hypothetical protein K0S40_2454 [Actinomycetospora sp.]|nr:hypothetical protein [Actinomycetospora sp.]
MTGSQIAAHPDGVDDVPGGVQESADAEPAVVGVRQERREGDGDEVHHDRAEHAEHGGHAATLQAD